MSMTDPIADLLTRIRNAQMARKPDVSVSSSKLKTALVKVLQDEGYVAGFHTASVPACVSTAARASCRGSRAVSEPPSSARRRA